MKYVITFILGAVCGVAAFIVLCCVYVLTEMGLPEDVPLLDHLAQVQWIPVELE